MSQAATLLDLNQHKDKEPPRERTTCSSAGEHAAAAGLGLEQMAAFFADHRHHTSRRDAELEVWNAPPLSYLRCAQIGPFPTTEYSAGLGV